MAIPNTEPFASMSNLDIANFLDDTPVNPLGGFAETKPSQTYIPGTIGWPPPIPNEPYRPSPIVTTTLNLSRFDKETELAISVLLRHFDREWLDLLDAPQRRELELALSVLESKVK